MCVAQQIVHRCLSSWWHGKCRFGGVKLGVKLNLTSLAFGLSLYYNYITTQISTTAIRAFTEIYPC